MRTHYGPWQPCWLSNQSQKHKSGRGPPSEHFWQVWLISVQRFQRRRFKCGKLTDGRRTLTHDKSSHGLWPGELKKIDKLRRVAFLIVYFLCIGKPHFMGSTTFTCGDFFQLLFLQLQVRHEDQNV